jgi:hypothetical protein
VIEETLHFVKCKIGHGMFKDEISYNFFDVYGNEVTGFAHVNLALLDDDLGEDTRSEVPGLLEIMVADWDYNKVWIWFKCEPPIIGSCVAVWRGQLTSLMEGQILDADVS